MLHQPNPGTRSRRRGRALVLICVIGGVLGVALWLRLRRSATGDGQHNAPAGDLDRATPNLTGEEKAAVNRANELLV